MKLELEMIKAGMAKYRKEYNTEPALAELEQIAKSEKKGLWADEKK